MRTRNAVALIVALVLSAVVLTPGAAWSGTAVTRVHWVDPAGDYRVHHGHPIPAADRRRSDLHETTFRVVRTGDRPVLRVDFRVGGYVDLPRVRQYFVVRVAGYLMEIRTSTKQEHPRVGIDDGRHYSHRPCAAAYQHAYAGGHFRISVPLICFNREGVTHGTLNAYTALIGADGFTRTSDGTDNPENGGYFTDDTSLEPLPAE